MPRTSHRRSVSCASFMPMRRSWIRDRGRTLSMTMGCSPSSCGRENMATNLGRRCSGSIRYACARITMGPVGSDRADATVSFAVGNDRNVVDYALVKVDGQWLIHDILKGVTPSL